MKSSFIHKIKPNLLEYFRVVCRCESFSQAAQILGVSQPSVSGAIKKLENELEVQLVERSSGGFSLTAPGRAVYNYALSLSDLTAHLEAELSEMKSGAMPAIHFGSCISEGVMMRDIHAFLDTHPDVNIILENRNMGRIPGLILSGHFDMAVLPTGGLSPAMLSVIYRKTEFGLLLPPGHPLSDFETISPEQLNGEAILLPEFQSSLGPALNEYSRRHGISFVLPSAPMARNLQTLRFMVNEGCGIGLFPLPEQLHSADDFPADSQFTRRLSSPFYVEFSLAWKKDKFLTGGMKLLIEYLQKK